MRGFLAVLLLAFAVATPALADGCGCAGPKEAYMKKYGTIKPPAFVPATTTAPTTVPAPGAPATGSAAVPVNPPATGQGG
ncbi:MAG: hypothetical protein AB7J30_20455 [Hyphomicrobium sp.]|uniref:hypothetical protein n=1 Tax=Hyphomicrobium sp. TaxID=82 RepID=UPI003D0E5E7B